MTSKRLSTGATAYYWQPPTRARRAGCPVTPEALGTDYGAAKQRCDEILNPHYQTWLKGETSALVAGVSVGTWDWMVGIYKKSPRYTGRPAETRKSYDRMLKFISLVPLTDGRKFGQLSLKSISPAAADRLYEKLKASPRGERPRTALLAMQVAKRAWNVAYRAESKLVPANNPFRKMDIEYRAKPTKIFSYENLRAFVAKADELGEQSIGTAALIAFNWLQREVDIIGRITWSRFRPADAPDFVRIIHFKTGAEYDVPLYDADGSHLWPDLTPRLDAAERHGTLIVTRDQPDRFKGVHLPWRKRHFLRRVAAIRKAAGISPDIKFMGLRHGGNTEGADANLSDAQLRALSGHKSQASLLRYAQTSVNQRRDGARKRRDSRTKAGNLSE
ncbi:tyrosine-type recombinase/integrase [Bradyrhizobium sp. BR 1433]|uniref:tyrosine-type recombinase/integrase n=1 Tax=Bradyrhizobium sp. BR 1433 TaxID=3447967 RepID=UPI003EE8008A